MLNVTRLLCGRPTPGDALRYGEAPSGGGPPQRERPVVVWGVTRRCNLFCIHCYADAHDRPYPGELTTEEGRALLADLAAFGVPAVLFSGGEPLTRPDLFELAAYARDLGLRCVLSTNGILIDAQAARRIGQAGFVYVGVSLDGVGPVHDKVRGKRGAYEAALAGLRRCRDQGLRVGLRFTAHRRNVDQIPAIFDLAEAEGIPRICVYHLAYAGRGDRIRAYDLAPQETRAMVDDVFARARELHRQGRETEVLTVDNHADGVYLYLRLRREEPSRAEEVLRLLRRNGGNRSGIAIAAIDPQGDVHADQFSWHYAFGNVRLRPFSAIWSDDPDKSGRLAILRDRKPRLKGRCGGCRYLDLCNGNLRARAERYFGDYLAPDPACYLSDAEIGLTPESPQWAEASRWPLPVQSLKPEAVS